ncbi:MAG: hypothetical protein AB1397_03980 [bacterium]
MREDPIVEEVHQARKQLFQESEQDLQKLMNYLQKCEEKEKDWQVCHKRRDKEILNSCSTCEYVSNPKGWSSLTSYSQQ